ADARAGLLAAGARARAIPGSLLAVAVAGAVGAGRTAGRRAGRALLEAARGVAAIAVRGVAVVALLVRLAHAVAAGGKARGGEAAPGAARREEPRYPAARPIDVRLQADLAGEGAARLPRGAHRRSARRALDARAHRRAAARDRHLLPGDHGGVGTRRLRAGAHEGRAVDDERALRAAPGARGRRRRRSEGEEQGESGAHRSRGGVCGRPEPGVKSSYEQCRRAAPAPR